MAILKIKNLKKKLDNKLTLEIENLEVKQGEVLSILGESGAGKTSLLRILAGLDQGAQGSIFVEGVEFSARDFTATARESKLGLVFQDYALFPHMSVRDNIAFASDDQAHIERLLELFQLSEHTNKLPQELSGGLKQRVAIARSLAAKPIILMLDEPFSNIDYFKRSAISEALFDMLRELDITVIFVTHNQEEALHLGDQIVLIKDGKIVEKGTPDEMYLTPKQKYTAQFVGDANFIEVKSDGKFLESSIGQLPFALKSGTYECVIRPEDVVVHQSVDGEFEIMKKTFYGHDTDLTLSKKNSDLTIKSRILGYNQDYKLGQFVDINVLRIHALG